MISSLLLFFPIKEVFEGKSKLEQQFGISIPENIPFLSNILGNTINIRYYAVCILIGVLSGYILTLKLSKVYKIAGTVIDRLLLGITVFGLIGARLFYVIFNLKIFILEPISILFVWLGGLAIFGAILGSALYLYLYCNRFKFNFYEFLDFLTPGLLLGQIFGRFGNFFNYESYGGPTSAYWKMYVPQTAKISENVNQEYFHPTFLYEVIPNIFVFLFILWFYEKLTLRRSGLVFGLYCICYGSIRFCTEFFRIDALRFDLPTRITFSVLDFQTVYVSQLCASIMCIVGIILVQKRKNWNTSVTL
ncbi:MAG: prolipoprotein diacylglyceryl transferase [candidate division SR1 bacterium]|nr:prolipoprotein diacylglyceryl transferase [candidate division SR1 bacterium]